MRAVRGRIPLSRGEEFWMRWAGMGATSESKPIQLARRKQTRGACTICTGTCRNGAGIFTRTTRDDPQPTPRDRRRARSECTAAAVGSTAPSSADRRSAPGARRATGAAAWASAPLQFPWVGRPREDRHQADETAILQAVNSILRLPPRRPECFSFAALARLISRSSISSVTSHFAGSGSRLPA
jgi:hypothetical protein